MSLVSNGCLHSIASLTLSSGDVIVYYDLGVFWCGDGSPGGVISWSSLQVVGKGERDRCKEEVDGGRQGRRLLYRGENYSTSSLLLANTIFSSFYLAN